MSSVNLFSKKEFFKLPHPRFKNHFLWTTKKDYNVDWEILVPYITLEELNPRGGSEKDKQVYLLQDLEAINPPITTAKTLVARRKAAAWLDSSFTSSSPTTEAESDSDGMSVEEDLCEDGDDEGTDMTILSAEVENVSGSDSVDRANEDSAWVEGIAPLTQSILKGVRKVTSDKPVTLVEYPVYSSTPPSTSYPPPELEFDSIHSLLSRLTAAIEKERKEHFTEMNNSE